MAEETKVALLERQLEKYPDSLDPDQVAEIMNVGRKTVDRLLDAGTLEGYVIDPTKERQEKRVVKAILIAYMINNKINGGM